LDKPSKKITGAEVRQAVEKINSAKSKIASPTGEKGDLVKKLRDSGLDMTAVNLVAKLHQMADEQRAAFWGTFQPGIDEMKVGPPKDLFTGTGADDKNANRKRRGVRDAVAEPALNGAANGVEH
jgi:uncharacterized protein (UPF0335 family)